MAFWFFFSWTIGYLDIAWSLLLIDIYLFIYYAFTNYFIIRRHNIMLSSVSSRLCAPQRMFDLL